MGRAHAIYPNICDRFYIRARFHFLGVGIYCVRIIWHTFNLKLVDGHPAHWGICNSSLFPLIWAVGCVEEMCPGGCLTPHFGAPFESYRAILFFLIGLSL